MTPSPTPTEAEKVVAEWRAAMEGVPAGKWQMKDFDVELSVSTMDGYAPLIADIVEQGDAQEPGHWGSEYQIGQWIARCSPSGISGLLALIESQRATIERVERERVHAVSEKLDEWLLRLDAEARVTALETEKAELRDRLGHWAITEEFDYPGDAAEFCGYWCHECNEHVEADGSGHGETCRIHSVAPNTPRARGEKPRVYPVDIARAALSPSTEVKNDGA